MNVIQIFFLSFGHGQIDRTDTHSKGKMSIPKISI